MQVLETRVYRGPNLYALWPVIRLRVDLGELEDYPTGRLPGFPERLLAALPTLHDHTCSYGAPGGFARRLTEDEGTWMGHVLEHVALELQGLAGTPVTYGKTRGKGLPRGHYNVVYSYVEEPVGLAAADTALALIRHLLPPERAAHDPRPFDLEAEIAALRRLVERWSFGPSTAALVRAAEDRDIPWMRLNGGALVQLGHGRYQKRLESTVTSGTSLPACEIARDKSLTCHILRDLAIPVPRQELVSGVEEAVEAALRLGLPVVVKPLDGNHGRGVSTGLATAEAVREAATEAADRSRSGDILVECHQQGRDYRLLVVGGRLVAAAERIPAHVVGDGRSTVAELVERVNADPRRGRGHERQLTRIRIGESALRLLARRGLCPESVPPEGETVFLSAAGNLSAGGTSIDRTDEVHPDVRRMAERAVAAVGLDVGGVDYLSPDVSRSFREVGGAVVEVNAGPGLRMHLSPCEGSPRDVAGPILDLLFPRRAPARIPIAAITGTNGKTTTARMVAHLLKLAGYRVGLTTSDGVYVDGERIAEGDLTGPWASRLVLREPTVDAAVLETARGGLLRSGLGWDKCNVGAVLNVGADHLGLGGIDDLDELARLKRIVVEVARDWCVLSADDPRVARMANHCPGDPIYVGLDPGNPRLARHLRSRGRAVVLERGAQGAPDSQVVLHDGRDRIPLLRVGQIPAALDGHALHNVANAMFAAAIAHGLGVGTEVVRQGLRTYRQDFASAPGRLNFYDGLPFRVLLDYAHNAPAMAATAATVRSLPVTGRRIGVLTAPGDRRDEDIRALAGAAAPAFDLMLLHEDEDRRGRALGEVPRLLSEGLLAAGFPAEGIRFLELPAGGAEEAVVEPAVRCARPGDLLAIFAAKPERCWRRIAEIAGTLESAETTETPETRETPETTRRVPVEERQPEEALAGVR